MFESEQRNERERDSADRRVCAGVERRRERWNAWLFCHVCILVSARIQVFRTLSLLQKYSYILVVMSTSRLSNICGRGPTERHDQKASVQLVEIRYFLWRRHDTGHDALLELHRVDAHDGIRHL